MPNWCVNDLIVNGNRKEVDRFIAAVAGSREDDTDFDFEKLIPYPKEYAVLDHALREWEDKYKNVEWSARPPRPSDGYNQGGYEWCCANWGTKWNASEAHLSVTTRGCRVSFTTAWSPPCPVIRKAAELFPTLTFKLKYWEGGMGFQGILTVKGDSTIEEWEGDYRGGRGG